MWRQLRALEDANDTGVTTVQVPTDGDYTPSSCKSCTSRKQLDQPQEVREALLERNKIHFGQAQGTFPTKSPFSEKITWEADTSYCDMLLNGSNPFEHDDIDDVSQLLDQFKARTSLDSITATLTEEEWCGKMQVWNEATTTSPSGLHLGHHKCLIREVEIPTAASGAAAQQIEHFETLEKHRKKMLKAQVSLINFAIKRHLTRNPIPFPPLHPSSLEELISN